MLKEHTCLHYAKANVNKALILGVTDAIYDLLRGRLIQINTATQFVQDC